MTDLLVPPPGDPAAPAVPAAPAAPRRARRHDRVLRVALVGLVAMAAVLATAARQDEPPPSTAGNGLGGAVGTLPAPPTTEAAPVLEAVDLPWPEPIPLNAHEATPEIVLGTLEIPKLEVSQPLQEGMTLTAINRGPSHWPGTALPGQVGNAVIAGHRTTYAKPFNRLDELVPGDQVIFRLLDGVHTYEVVEVTVIAPDDLYIGDQTYAHTATLFACHPKGSARQRIVATLRLLGPDGRPVDEVTPPRSDLRRDAYTKELYVLAPDAEHRPGQPPNLSAPGSSVAAREDAGDYPTRTAVDAAASGGDPFAGESTG